ncbi:MAG: Cro/Cl family transcriptional regulator, partial [Sulfurovaceae bacterium]
IDARGNKEGVDAQFTPPHEKLAFELNEGEYNLPGLYAEPLNVVIKALRTRKDYNEMVGHFPDHI